MQKHKLVYLYMNLKLFQDLSHKLNDRKIHKVQGQVVIHQNESRCIIMNQDLCWIHV